MKSIIIIAVLIFSTVDSKYLKSEQSDAVIQKSVDPKSVKSLGEFSNISPDATRVITPKYASKFCYLTLKNLL
jgi:hypothetical protein